MCPHLIAARLALDLCSILSSAYTKIAVRLPLDLCCILSSALEIQNSSAICKLHEERDREWEWERGADYILIFTWSFWVVKSEPKLFFCFYFFLFSPLCNKVFYQCTLIVFTAAAAAAAQLPKWVLLQFVTPKTESVAHVVPLKKYYYEFTNLFLLVARACERERGRGREREKTHKLCTCSRCKNFILRKLNRELAPSSLYYISYA